jgi:hypothetical protein
MRERSPERQTVLDAIVSTGIPVGPKDIATATGMRSQNVRFLLHKLVKEYAVKKVSYGKYVAFPALRPSSTPRCIEELHPRHVGWLKD